MDVPRLVVLLAVALVSAACTDGDSGHFSARVVAIGSARGMYLECAGAGSPTVVLIAGKGNRADTWQTTRTDPGNAQVSVFSRAAALSRVCAYDRPLTLGADGEPSRSDPVPAPVTAREGVADLHALLAAAQVPGPYVLVGHSYGGLIARLYASDYRSAVAGVVLEDALAEGLYAGLTAAQRDVLEAINLEPERVDTVGSFAQVIGAPRIASLPMVILTADRPPIGAQDVASGALPPAVTIAFVEALWGAQVAAQASLAALFPFAHHVTNTGSRHYIHLEQPQVVGDAIREVIEAIRTASR